MQCDFCRSSNLVCRTPDGWHSAINAWLDRFIASEAISIHATKDVIEELFSEIFRASMKAIVYMPTFFYGSMFFIMLVVWVTPPFTVVGIDVSSVPRYVLADVPLAVGFISFILGGIYLLRSKVDQRRATHIALATYWLTHGGIIISGLLYFAMGTWYQSSEVRQFYSAQCIGVFFIGWLLEWWKYRYFSSAKLKTQNSDGVEQSRNESHDPRKT